MKIGGIYTIDFAKISEIYNFSVNIKNGDQKRYLNLRLLENNQILNLNNYTITINAKKNDGTCIFNNVEIVNAEDGICKFEITKQMTIASHNLPCEITLFDKNGTIATSSNFILNIVPNLRDDETILSSNEFTALSEALSKVQGIDERFIDVNSQLSKVTDSLALKSTIEKLSRQQFVRGICYGDSLTAGAKAGGNGEVTTNNPYPTALKNYLKEIYRYDNIDIINKGIPGFNSTQIKDKFLSEIDALNTDFIILMMGTNDLFQGIDSSVLKENFKTIIDKCKSKNIELVIMTIPNVQNGYKDAVNLYNSIISSLEGIELVDLNKELSYIYSENFIAPIDLQPDFVHFADNYYKFIADILISKAFFKNVITPDKLVPAAESSSVITDATVLRILTDQTFKSNLFMKIKENTNGNYIKAIFYNNKKNMRIYTLNPYTENGGIAYIYNNDVKVSEINCNSSAATVDNLNYICMASFGLNIITIKCENGESVNSKNDFYINAFGIKYNPDFDELNLINGFENVGGEFQPAKERNLNGMTYLSGVISEGNRAQGTVIATLKNKPHKKHIFNIACENGAGIVSINQYGSLEIFILPGSGWISLDGISF